MGQRLLSQRDSMIVARHEVPAFVPEGQADRSQARSAWVSMQRGPRPGGTVEVMVRDICRPNGVHAALETLGIPVERYVGV
jgi:hypothetical protein